MKTARAAVFAVAAVLAWDAGAEAWAGAPFDSDESRSLYPTRWVMTCGKNRRRALAVKLDDSGRIEHGSLAWADYPDPPENVEGSLSRDGSGVRLDVKTGSGSTLVATGADASRMEATFAGGEKSRKCSLAAADGRADFYRQAYFPNSGAAVTLVAVNAMNCAPCNAWKFAERDAWKKTPSFSRVAYREVEAYTFAKTDDESVWPDDLKWVLKATQAKSGSPRFLLLDGHDVVMNVLGRDDWKRIMLPVLEAVPAP